MPISRAGLHPLSVSNVCMNLSHRQRRLLRLWAWMPSAPSPSAPAQQPTCGCGKKVTVRRRLIGVGSEPSSSCSSLPPSSLRFFLFSSLSLPFIFLGRLLVRSLEEPHNSVRRSTTRPSFANRPSLRSRLKSFDRFEDGKRKYLHFFFSGYLRWRCGESIIIVLCPLLALII